jgi:hypothetical protein
MPRELRRLPQPARSRLDGAIGEMRSKLHHPAPSVVPADFSLPDRRGRIQGQLVRGYR